MSKSADGEEVVVVEATVVEVVDVVDVDDVVVVGSVVEVVGAGGLGLPQANAGPPLATREPTVTASVAANAPPTAYKLWRPRPW
ncbi:MAG: hypothetical protein ABSA91_18110 [Acidimicrobiales bacterium]